MRVRNIISFTLIVLLMIFVIACGSKEQDSGDIIERLDEEKYSELLEDENYEEIVHEFFEDIQNTDDFEVYENTKTENDNRHISELTRYFDINTYSDGYVTIDITNSARTRNQGWAITDAHGNIIYDGGKEEVVSFASLQVADIRLPVWNNIIKIPINGGIRLINIITGDSVEILNSNTVVNGSENGLIWVLSEEKTLSDIIYSLNCYDDELNCICSIVPETIQKAGKIISDQETGVLFLITKDHQVEVIDHKRDLGTALNAYREKLINYFSSSDIDFYEIVDISDRMIRFKDSYFFNVESNEYLYIDNIPEFEGASKFYAGPCGEGLIAVEMESSTGRFAAIIDKTANVVCAPTDKFHFIYTYSNDLPEVYFSEGLCVAINQVYGYIDCDGNWVIQPQYTSADEYSEGYARVHSYGETYIIDKVGNIVLVN